MHPEPSVPEMGFPRRTFLRQGIAGALLTAAAGKGSGGPSDALNAALVGCGFMGESLIRATARNLVPLRWVAFCDIIESKCKLLGRKAGLKDEAAAQWSHSHVETMLMKHPELDVIFIATPDWLHESMTIQCLRAGKHVYCEKPMATSAEGAANMVRAQRETGRLLQIGYQRRSNPTYQRCREELVHRLKLCGRMTHAYTQWNRGVTLPINARYSEMQVEAISAAGYESVFQFLNWRHFKKHGSGEFANLAGMQVDVLNWFFGTPPTSVMAAGGLDYYKDLSLKDGRNFSYEHQDSVTAIFDYDVPENGLVRALCGIQTTNSHMAHYEKFMGVNGTITLSEVGSEYEEEFFFNRVYREAWDSDLRKWDEQYFKKGYLGKTKPRIHHKFWEREKTWREAEKPYVREGDLEKWQAVVRDSQPLDEYVIPWQLNTPCHTPHVENFLKTVQSGGKQEDLNCPAEEAYKTAVAVLKAQEVAETTAGKYYFKPVDFVVE